ncbi:hypothetical protein C1H46_040163 [Malus baccata]|uniref:Uncharacterized protein n=1 Tax=Malus baccata TaxID=106549 RepID=A0A540KJV6_MALBA|nr:hypothetical protein C1H46_040163 [Malus baccata]
MSPRCLSTSVCHSLCLQSTHSLHDIKRVRPGLLVGKCGAHPRLDVAHLKPERRGSAS